MSSHVLRDTMDFPIQFAVELSFYYQSSQLTHLSLASLLWDLGKQNSPRCDAAERGVPSGAILFARRIFIKNLFKN